MKRVLVIVFVFISFVICAQEPRLKLAVMEFEDRSETLDIKMLSNAAEYLRGEFVGSKSFIVIAKERQEKELIKQMKKESHSICKDKSCQIPLGQALSADTIMRTTINFFGGIYTITTELIDLAKEATVRGAKFKFDGSEQGLMKAMDRIVVQLAGKNVSFKPGVLKADEVKGVELGGVELSELPTVEVAEGNFEDVEVSSELEKVEVDSALALEADADIMVAYDEALTADEGGEKYPEIAMRKWEKLASMKGTNPFKQKAELRYSEWKKHIQMKKTGAVFERAKRLDKYGKLFPASVIKAWKDVIDFGDSPYMETARERFGSWNYFKNQIDDFKAQQDKFEKQRIEDQKKLIKVLPLRFLKDQQKRAMMVKYLEIYAPFYGVDDVEFVFQNISPDKSKKLMALLYNDYLNKEMEEKCKLGKGSACYISASLTELENPEVALSFFEKACSGGVPDACIKAGKAYYDKKDEKAAQYFTTACSWGSPEGCHVMGFFSEIGFGIEKNADVAERLYGKACGSGYDISCRMLKNIKKYGYSSDQVKAIAKGQKIDIKISNAVGTEGDDLAQEVKPKANFNDASMTVKEKEKYHPYLKGGVTMIVLGAGLILGGVTGFQLASNSKFDSYNSRTTDAKIVEAITSGVNQEDYLKSVNKYKDKGELYNKLAIVSGVTGGVLIISGIITASVTKEREVLKKVSFSTDGKGFYAGLGFEF